LKNAIEYLKKNCWKICLIEKYVVYLQRDLKQ
jgi:hypothetical protein